MVENHAVAGWVADGQRLCEPIRSQPGLGVVSCPPATWWTQVPQQWPGLTLPGPAAETCCPTKWCTCRKKNKCVSKTASTASKLKWIHTLTRPLQNIIFVYLANQRWITSSHKYCETERVGTKPFWTAYLPVRALSASLLATTLKRRRF